jgi:ABC-type Na+ efflux pump permease subunit
MKGKYKKFYLVAFLLFVIINIAAVFVVFKKYRKDSSNSMMVSNAKFKLSQLKEKVNRLESKLPVEDSILNQEFVEIKFDQQKVDSMLNIKSLDNESLQSLANKIVQLTEKSGEVEKYIESIASTQEISSRGN